MFLDDAAQVINVDFPAGANRHLPSGAGLPRPMLITFARGLRLPQLEPQRRAGTGASFLQKPVRCELLANKGRSTTDMLIGPWQAFSTPPATHGRRLPDRRASCLANWRGRTLRRCHGNVGVSLSGCSPSPPQSPSSSPPPPPPPPPPCPPPPPLPPPPPPLPPPPQL